MNKLVNFDLTKLILGIELVVSDNRSSLSADDLSILEEAIVALKEFEKSSSRDEKRAKILDFINLIFRFFAKYHLIERFSEIFSDIFTDVF